MPDVFSELLEVDDLLGIQPGVTRAVVSLHDESQRCLLNERLRKFGVQIDERFLPTDRDLWRVLMKTIGVSNAWWFDGDCSVLPPQHVKRLSS